MRRLRLLSRYSRRTLLASAHRAQICPFLLLRHRLSSLQTRPTFERALGRTVYSRCLSTVSSSRIADDDTIYALSTASGRAAIAVIRISGPACLAIYGQLCPSSAAPKPRHATLRRLHHPKDPGQILDTGALLLYLPGPRTATGEDILELHVHGGPAIVRSVLDAIAACREIVRHPIRAAEAGEFTKRAFYNGRIDLTEVEALGDALVAETEQQRRLAVSGAASALTDRYEQWRSMLLYARGELEALIDFSEDQHFDESPDQFMHSVSKQVLHLKREIELHILNSSRGEMLRSGINVALLGAPNAGKSSLLNRIVGREAAIVSAEAGTTRDIVEVNIDLKGWLVHLGDMAGLRAGSSDTHVVSNGRQERSTANAASVGEIEREGIRRARERALQSDLVIVLISIQLTPHGTVELAFNEELVSAVADCRRAGKEMLFVVNKVDLVMKQAARHKVSISRLLADLVHMFPQMNQNEVFCISCQDAELQAGDESDAGALQMFMDSLVTKFRTMTTALADVSASGTVRMTPAEEQSYWAASLTVSHRQSQYLKECLTSLEAFLEVSSPGTAAAFSATIESPTGIEPQSSSPDRWDSMVNDVGHSTHTWSTSHYHIDGHQDLVGEQMNKNDLSDSTPAMPTASHQKIPYSRATSTTSRIEADHEEFEIVTAAEHLRSAADHLARLTGRGDGTTSGIDVEDVLGVVFEK